jgi:uncharacterized protein YdaU (DUF1376 family)
MAEKSPAFQFYPADYLADAKVQFLTSAQEGIYIRLLCYCWREGSVPSDPKQALLSCKRDAKLKDVADVLKTFFVPSNDATQLLNPRLEKEREKQLERRHQASEAGRISATKRQRNSNDRSTTVQRPLDSRCDSVATNTPTEFNPSSSSSFSTSSSPSEKEINPSDIPFDPTFGGSWLPGPSKEFEAWWATYPVRTGKNDAWEAWQAAIMAIQAARGWDEPKATAWLLQRTGDYRDSPAGGVPVGGSDFRPAPAKWLKSGRYDDDPVAWMKSNGDSKRISVGAGQVTAGDDNRF